MPATLPLFSTLTLTAVATVGKLVVPSISSDQTIRDVLEGVIGIASNIAASRIERTASTLYDKVIDSSIDPKTGLPRNHDVAKASAQALQAAATALILELYGRADPSKPWLDQLQRFMKRGSLRRKLVLAVSSNPEVVWLHRLQQRVESDAFKHWHAALSFPLNELGHWFDPHAGGLKSELPDRFAAWAREVVDVGTEPGRLEAILREGWVTGKDNEIRLSLGEVYSLFFREYLKQRPEVFRILVAGELADQTSQLRTIDERLKDFVGQSAALLNGLQVQLDQLHLGHRQLSNQLGHMLRAMVTLRTEALRGDQRAAQAASELQRDTAALIGSFKSFEKRLFGLPLVRPNVLIPDPNDELWVVKARYRGLDLIGREAEMDELMAWLDKPARISIRLLIGGAGSGKTRLAYEFLWRIAAEREGLWDAGRIASRDLRLLTEGVYAVNWTWDRDTIVVVDYARAADDALRLLLRELVRRSEQEGEDPKFRLLLLERTQSATADWIDELFQEGSFSGGRLARQLFDPPSAVSIRGLDGPELRRRQFQATLAALGDRELANRVPPVGEDARFDALLASSSWSDPLVPIMAALVARRDRSVYAGELMNHATLALALASNESERLLRYVERTPPLMDGHKALMKHVAALVVMCGGASRDDAIRLAAQESQHLRLAWPDGEGGLVLVLLKAWSGRPGHVAQLKPDIVGEAFVLRFLGGEESRDQGLNALLRHLTDHGKSIVGIVLRAFHNFQGDAKYAATLSDWAQQLVDHGLAQREPALIGALDDAMPWSTAALRVAALSVTQARYDHHASQFLASQAEDAERLQFAALTLKLSARHAAMGPRQEALNAAVEAVGHYRELHKKTPHLYREGLARALNALAGRHANLRHFAPALELMLEAMALVNDLEQQWPDRFRPDQHPSLLSLKAMMLNGLAMRLAALGQYNEAIVPANSAHRIFRELANRDPSSSRELESSLHTLAECYAGLGDKCAALENAQEAELIYRGLAERNPDCFEQGWAAALNSLGERLADCGRMDQAIECANKAVECYRRLLRHDSEAFRPGLAAALENLGKHCRQASHQDEATAYTREAVELRRELDGFRPEAFRAGLGRSLIQLAQCCIDVNDRDCAAAAAEQSVMLLSECAARDPGLFQPLLNEAHAVRELVWRWLGQP